MTDQTAGAGTPPVALSPSQIAVHLAHHAAVEVSGRDHWWCNGTANDGAPTVDAAAEIAAFLREFPGAPAEASYIRGSATGVHDGAVKWCDVDAPVRLGYRVFAGVLRLLDDELDQAAEAERTAATARQAPPRREDTIFETEDGPGAKLDEMRPRAVPREATWNDADQVWEHPDGRRYTAKGKRIRRPS